MGQLTSSLNFWKPTNKTAEHSGNFSYKNKSITPYVYIRRGSMYVDEDGDLAHEFYEEIKTRRGIKMKKISNDNLIPQGYIKLSIPRLNKEIPIIIHEVKS